jgi:sodium/potassium-transporting ATPase subunit alpha
VDAVVIHGDELIKAMAEDENLPEEMKGARLARWLTKKEVVFARTTPAQKLIIVEGHQKLGHIVAVTGDGVNDSPAIKKADIGIAMNIVGSDVAKDSADLLLLDDNFCSIVSGIEEGRLMFDNLKKTIIYSLVVNIPELAPVLGNMILGFPMPLTTIFMLLICVVTDIIPAIAMAYEQKEMDIMRRKPRNADVDHLVTWKLMFHSYAILGVTEIFGGHYTYFYVLNDFGFPPEKLFGLNFAMGCEPNPTDVYNPLDPNAGNTNLLGCSEAAPDWVNGDNSKVDLRLWFYSYGPDKWGSCEYPDLESSVHSGAYYCYGTEALQAAQGSYFAALVAMQWIAGIICRTRFVNLWQQGLNNRVIWFGIALETVVAVLVLYVPGLNEGIGGRPLMPLHLFVPAMPFCIMFFVMDEGRKLVNRLYREKYGRRSALEKVSQF